MSNIGPNTKNETIALSVNVLRNEEAINASAEEQSDNTYASPIITAFDETSPCPNENRVDVLTNVCIPAAINPPIIRNFPTEKNSSIG